MIKEEDPNYFKEIKIQLIQFSCKIVATNILINMNKAKFRYIFKKMVLLYWKKIMGTITKILIFKN